MVDVNIPIRHNLELAIGASDKKMFAVPSRRKRSVLLGLSRGFCLVDHGCLDPRLWLNKNCVHQVNTVGAAATCGLRTAPGGLGHGLHSERISVGGLSLAVNQLLDHCL